MTSHPSVLFEEKRRTDTDAIRADESTFQFLDRIERDNAEMLRRRANELYACYPDGPAKQKLWDQLSAPRLQAFDEFYFEMQVCDYLRRDGVNILEIEPALEGVTTTPDFLCEVQGQRFFVEVVTIHDNPPHRQQVDFLEPRTARNPRRSGRGQAPNFIAD